MHTKSVTLIVIALGCGLIASIGISQMMDQGSHEPERFATATVLLANTDIDIGEGFTADNVRLEAWPPDRIPVHAVGCLEAVKDRFPRTRMHAGEVILSAQLVERGTLRLSRPHPNELDEPTVASIATVSSEPTVSSELTVASEPTVAGEPIVAGEATVEPIMGRPAERADDKASSGNESDDSAPELVRFISQPAPPKPAAAAHEMLILSPQGIRTFRWDQLDGQPRQISGHEPARVPSQQGPVIPASPAGAGKAGDDGRRGFSEAGADDESGANEYTENTLGAIGARR